MAGDRGSRWRSAQQRDAHVHVRNPEFRAHGLELCFQNDAVCSPDAESQVPRGRVTQIVVLRNLPDFHELLQVAPRQSGEEHEPAGASAVHRAPAVYIGLGVLPREPRASSAANGSTNPADSLRLNMASQLR